uniref:Uncharacterized protein n=1 Tax=Oryzias latipes TaxID=8090 RepID=A0A3P9LU74_ORYLA
MGELFQCPFGHKNSGHLHSWKADGFGPDHSRCLRKRRLLYLWGSEGVFHQQKS